MWCMLCIARNHISFVTSCVVSFDSLAPWIIVFFVFIMPAKRKSLCSGCKTPKQNHVFAAPEQALCRAASWEQDSWLWIIRRRGVVAMPGQISFFAFGHKWPAKATWIAPASGRDAESVTAVGRHHKRADDNEKMNAWNLRQERPQNTACQQKVSMALRVLVWRTNARPCSLT